MQLLHRQQIDKHDNEYSQLETVFFIRSMQRVYKEDNLWDSISNTSAIASLSNTPAMALRVVGGDKKGTQCLGYNRATLFVGDINTGTWPSRLGESRI
jgi:hypothetical protein